MTPKNKIRREILRNDPESCWGPLDTDEQVNDAYEEFSKSGCRDLENEFRWGEVETNLYCPSSRHYETKSVAALTELGWVGWCCWFGGGKHGCPEEIPWMDDSYDLEVTEEEKMVVVRTFKRVGQ